MEKRIIQGEHDKRASGRPPVNCLNNITGWIGMGLQDFLKLSWWCSGSALDS